MAKWPNDDVTKLALQWIYQDPTELRLLAERLSASEGHCFVESVSAFYIMHLQIKIRIWKQNC
jgi:hypothetical protein